MKILLISFVDSTNLGDQLIVKSISKDLSKFGEVKLLSYNLTLPSKNIKFENKSPNKLKAAYTKYLRALPLFDFIHGLLLKYSVKRLNWMNLERAIQNVDLVVFGGGNAIFGLTPHTATTYKVNRIVDFIKEKNKPIFLLSAGIGPFLNEKQINDARSLLKKFDAITVRDRRSFSYVNDLENSFQSVDPVFFIENERDGKIKNNQIGLCVMDIRANKVSEREYQKYLTSMKALVKNLLAEYPTKKIILFSSEPKDNSAVQDLYDKFSSNSRVIMKITSTIDELVELYKEIDFLIGTRMHSMIVAYTQSIPVAGISWQPKVTEFFDLIKKSDHVFTLKEFEKNIPKLVKFPSEFELNEEKEVRAIKSQLDILRKSYQINNELVQSISEGMKNGKI